ncbi:MAG: DotI/IcmL/TraM family protein, partial [Roseomonas mucosa]|nr:DotI/IcmL/TraM family protein [Roseomonas mucosa]
SYQASGNFEAMKAGRMVCYAQAQRAATIADTQIVRGRLSHTVQFPIVQTCENSQQTSQTNLTISTVVVRTNDEDRPDGLMIDQLVAIAR